MKGRYEITKPHTVVQYLQMRPASRIKEGFLENAASQERDPRAWNSVSIQELKQDVS